jgi:hypothetical protein
MLYVESVRLAADAVKASQNSEGETFMILVLPYCDVGWVVSIVGDRPVTAVLSKPTPFRGTLVDAAPLRLVARLPADCNQDGRGDVRPV